MTVDFRNTEAALKSGELVNFAFGQNWTKYVADLDELRVQEAAASLREAFASFGLVNERFIDVGSGSGLFSLCALRSGAGEIISIDVDPQSIACARWLRHSSGNPENWTIAQGSILDTSFVRRTKPASRVYSWGVLHHTGAMWAAVESAMTLVAPGGLLCLALYNRPNHAALQMALKRTYNRLPRSARPLLRVLYGSALLAAMAVAHRRNPVEYVRDYGRRSRGMRFWRDVEDWLGGLPCEFADEHEVRDFASSHGFVVERVLRRGPGGNNEYLLRRKSESVRGAAD
jgi:2-polyprenyl-6-hydroxyphenyl methylase/3-demethylubiquinone-9 3-methyltransferase